MLFRWRKSRDKADRKAKAGRRRKADVPELPLEPDEPEQAEEPVPFDVMASVQTDVGCHREVNEDAIRFVKPSESERGEAKGMLALVADGMGGHAAGEVASRMAVDIISRLYYESDKQPTEALDEAFHAANKAINEAVHNDAALEGMGTTCTAVVLHKGRAISAHVGDSRLYLIRNGSIYIMSEDHSLVREMVKNGVITQEEARRHEDKNVILRALGIQPEVEVAMWSQPFRVQIGDQLLLCSDGLSDLVEDDEIKQAVLAADPHGAGQHLIALAKERGGYDNISVGILRLQEIGDLEEAAAERETRVSAAIGVDGASGTDVARDEL
ncbi:MAG: Stp1/IreP family PP2C-type Ser/Thr phosphatase [Rhodothermales bacterium]